MAENHLSAWMTVIVIDVLEVIDIKHDDAYRISIPTTEFQQVYRQLP